MRIYSDFAARRTVEVVGDLVAIAVVVVGILVAVALHDAIATVGTVGRSFETSGQDFSDSMTDIGANLSGVPLIGTGIAAPFDGASAAGQTLAAAGRSFQNGVATLAAFAGWTVGGLVVLVVVLGWIRPRLAASVRRQRLARLAASAPTRDLLAFRALANRPPRQLAGLDDPVGGWRAGRTATVDALAALELRASGVRLRPQ